MYMLRADLPRISCSAMLPVQEDALASAACFSPNVRAQNLYSQSLCHKAFMSMCRVVCPGQPCPAMLPDAVRCLVHRHAVLQMCLRRITEIFFLSWSLHVDAAAWSAQDSHIRQCCLMQRGALASQACFS